MQGKKSKASIFSLYFLGQQTHAKVIELFEFINFVGEVFYRLFIWLKQPNRILWRSLAHTIEISGVNALPIIGLLSLLIGIVLSYQMGEQLQTYGATIFIVNLLGISILREFAPLLTAIIVAGRSGSAFTAQIGTMVVNQEVDALKTMGVAPVEQLVLQKIIGLMIALPLLTVWSSICSILGGMVMSNILYGISYSVFLHHFASAISVKQLIIGLIKTPVFAVLIACIGCFQGLRVVGTADSVGKQTTKSVVQAIFLIIIADAFFSIVLSWYHL